MTLKAPKTTTEYERAPEGVHFARIVRIVQIGTVKTSWKGKEKSVVKILVTMELPTTKNKDDKPFQLHERYTLSMFESSMLRKFVENVTGVRLTDDLASDFDIMSLLGVECQVSVAHEKVDGKTYERINSVMPLAKGITLEKTDTPLVACYYGMPNFQEVYDTLPSWIQKVVSETPEGKEALTNSF